jgi:hypothetical protein
MKQQTMESIAYTSFCSMFDMKPEWLGRTFENRGKTYTISGLNIRSKKFPVLTKEGAQFSAVYIRGLMTGDPKLFEKTQQANRDEKLKQARIDYKTNCFLYVLEPSWQDETFVFKGTTYRIDGLLTNSRRYNIVCRKENNDPSYFPAELVLRLMKEQHSMKKKAA